uniref:Gustatory receptor n=1 Tax=Anopheles albimanus TaxID=7167 RepID=A0A182F638_ANOAL
MSIRVLSGIVVLFQIVGFYSFSLRFLHTRQAGMSIGEHSWSVGAWWLLQLCCSVVSVIMARVRYHLLFEGLMATEAMNNYLKYAIGVVTVFVTLADSWCHYDAHRSIWMRYEALTNPTGAYLGLMNRSSTARLARHFGVKFLVVTVTCLSVEYQVYRFIAADTQWHWFWLYNLYPSTISRMRHMFHLLHISLLTCNLRELDRQIRESTLPSIKRQLEDSRTLFTELALINEHINDIFGWSQAFNIASSFVQMAFDLYWAYEMMVHNENQIEVQMLCFVPTPLIIGILLHAAKCYRLAVNAIEKTLLDIPFQRDPTLDRVTFFFLKQLQQSDMRLTARNIFDFDYTLFSKFAVGIATYVVIFIEITN